MCINNNNKPLTLWIRFHYIWHFTFFSFFFKIKKKTDVFNNIFVFYFNLHMKWFNWIFLTHFQRKTSTILKLSFFFDLKKKMQQRWKFWFVYIDCRFFPFWHLNVTHFSFRFCTRKLCNRTSFNYIYFLCLNQIKLNNLFVTDSYVIVLFLKSSMNYFNCANLFILRLIIFIWFNIWNAIDWFKKNDFFSVASLLKSLENQ